MRNWFDVVMQAQQSLGLNYACVGLVGHSTQERLYRVQHARESLAVQACMRGWAG
jgi:hypothetical protein